MAVLLPNRMLGVRRRNVGAVDAHGDRPGSGWAALAGPWPGRAEEGPDVPPRQIEGRTWRLAVDPAGWPLHQGDLVVDPAGPAEWLVTSADLLINHASPEVDYIRVEAHLRTTAGTRP